MLGDIFIKNTDLNVSGFREGDLYKTVRLHGHTFELYYGFYEECDRENPDIEPMPIYPNFLKEPKYTASGLPFVTKMQDSCKYYKGKHGKETECADCEYYKHGEELIGVCSCPENSRGSPKKDLESAKTINDTEENK